MCRWKSLKVGAHALTRIEDEVNLAILENLTVDLTIPLLGGKVHGSLARAGKVRGQTPKVDAQEKKKKRTGIDSFLFISISK